MSTVETKEVTAFLKATIKQHQFAVAPVHRGLFERATRCLQAEGDLATARGLVRTTKAEIDGKGKELERLDATATKLRNKLAELASRHEDIRRNRVGAALNEALDGSTTTLLVLDRKLGEEIADLRAVIDEADARKVRDMATLTTLQNRLREQLRVALDARVYLADGVLMMMESRLSVALSEHCSLLRLAGQRGAFQSIEIEPDADAFEAAYNHFHNQLSVLLEG